jgi:amidohydrolase
MGSEDNFVITLSGKGGHGAMPHLCVDPLLVGCHVVTALQSIVSRVADPVDPLVVSVTQFNAGSAFNVTPSTAELRGTIRAFDPETRAMAKQRLQAIAETTAQAHGAVAAVQILEAFPPTVNDAAKAQLAAQVATKIVGAANVVEPKPTVASEDFSYMLRARPGCYIWLGNRSAECASNLHECTYDFNDDVLPIGASIFAALVEELQPVE